MDLTSLIVDPSIAAAVYVLVLVFGAHVPAKMRGALALTLAIGLCVASGLVAADPGTAVAETVLQSVLTGVGTGALASGLRSQAKATTEYLTGADEDVHGYEE